MMPGIWQLYFAYLGSGEDQGRGKKAYHMRFPRGPHTEFSSIQRFENKGNMQGNKC